MEAFKNILVPVDFEAGSDRALNVALDLAMKFDSKLTLLHAYVVPVSGYGYEGGFMWPIDDIARAAQKGLDASIAKAKERRPNVEGVLVYGEPWRQILQVAAERGADVIVMGTHGRHGLAHALLGSVAEKVVRLSRIPVLTVSTPDERRTRVPAETPADEPPRPKPRPLIRL